MTKPRTLRRGDAELIGRLQRLLAQNPIEWGEWTRIDLEYKLRDLAEGCYDALEAAESRIADWQKCAMQNQAERNALEKRIAELEAEEVWVVCPQCKGKPAPAVQDPPLCAYCLKTEADGYHAHHGNDYDAGKHDFEPILPCGLCHGTGRIKARRVRP